MIQGPRNVGGALGTYKMKLKDMMQASSDSMPRDLIGKLQTWILSDFAIVSQLCNYVAAVWKKLKNFS